MTLGTWSPGEWGNKDGVVGVILTLLISEVLWVSGRGVSGGEVCVRTCVFMPIGDSDKPVSLDVDQYMIRPVSDDNTC